MIHVSRFALVVVLLLSASSVSAPADESSGWTVLGDGLQIGYFRADHRGVGGDSTVVVLRAEPSLWSLDLLCTTQSEGRPRRTARSWCEQHGLVAAINAGMFATDYETHVGYCSVRGHVNSAGINDYQSIAAFCSRDGQAPLFRIFDLDAPGVTIEGICELYECVVQNLRLIKRPREGRWPRQTKRWSEAALGEDSEGRLFFIFCRTAYSMHDLNEILLSLPIRLVCAQHLEGGPEAQLFIRTDRFEAEYVGSYETDFHGRDDNRTATRIPVVFGLRPRAPEGSRRTTE